MEQIHDYFTSNYISQPSSTECIEFQRFMFHSQQQCLNFSLCSSNISRSDADIVSSVFNSLSPLRDANIEQMLQLIDSCPGDGVDLLADSLRDKGFVICVVVELLAGEDEEAIAATVRTRLSNLVASVTGRVSNVSSFDSNACPALPSDNNSRRRRSIVDDDMVRIRRNTGTVAPSNTTVQLAFLSSGDNAVSLSTLCDNTSTVGDASLGCSVCGNGVLNVANESCDDGNEMSGDGCSSDCVIEPGYDCNVNVAPSVCINKTCGDAILVSGEECDNGNQRGCSNCLIVQGFECSDVFYESSVCFSCGNRLVEEPEQCDNGLSGAIDGCNNTCSVDPLWDCTSVIDEESVCKHVAVNFNVADVTTLNPPVIDFIAAGAVLFLVEEVGQLDSSRFSNTVSKHFREIILFMMMAS